MHIKPADHTDLTDITSLLTNANLLADDLDPELKHFFVAVIEEQIVAAGGLEIYETNALLRSLVVKTDIRGKQLGTSLYRELMQHARSNNVTHVYLLTGTAETFFQTQGFRVIDRSVAPVSIQQTQQFSGLCPDSATLMVQNI